MGRSKPPLTKASSCFRQSAGVPAIECAWTTSSLINFLAASQSRFATAAASPCLIDRPAAQANILRMVHVAENVGEKKLVGFDRFFGVVGHRRGDKSSDIALLESLAGLFGAGFDLATQRAI